MASKQRISALERQIKASQSDNLRFTAVITLEGFPLCAQAAPSDAPGKFWAFSHGINSTFQYEVTNLRLPRIVLEVPIESELGSENGEGVDMFTPHGTKKQQLLLTIYPSINEAPYWFKQMRRPEGSDGKGLFLTLCSRIPHIGTSDHVKIMEWPFFQVGPVVFDGGTNIMKNLQGAKISVSFEPDDFAR